MPQRVNRSPPRESKGGIIKPPNYKSFVVNIRPRLWGKMTFWIGKFENVEDAMRVADVIYFYIGKPPFHFKDAVVTYPPLSCIGTVIGSPVKLVNQEMCSRYVREIAKGENFLPQRLDFMLQVKNVIRRTCLPFLAVIGDDNNDREVEVPPMENDRDEEAPQMENDREEEAPQMENDREEEAPPMEDDEHSAKALQMSSNSCLTVVVPTHVEGVDAVCRSDTLQAYVPSFAFYTDGSERILRSAEESLNQIQFSMNDCPTTLSEDEKECRSWREAVEGLNKSSATGTCTLSAVSNAGEVYQEWFTPPIMSQCASPLSKTTCDIVVPVECAVTTGIENWPSSQVPMDAKRQKIGD